MRPPLTDRPLTFSILVTLAFIVSLLVIVIGSRPLAADAIGLEAAGAVGRFLVAGLGLWALARLGWSRSAGIRQPDADGWRIGLPVLAYVLVVYPPLFTGGYGLRLDEPLLAVMVGANGFAAGVAEEVVFRGLVLYALIRAWGTHRDGIVRALIASSALFSSPHLLNLLAGADALLTSAQLVWAFLLGGVFGILVIVSRSLWPAALVHGLGNAFMHLNRLGETVTPDAGTALLLAAAPIPLVLYAAWRLDRSDYGLAVGGTS